MQFSFSMYDHRMSTMATCCMNCFTSTHLTYPWPSYLGLPSMSKIVDLVVTDQSPIQPLLGTFVGFQGTAHTYQYIGDSGRVQYAHHAVVDKLCVHCIPSDRSPAAKALLDHSAGDQSVTTHSTTPWLIFDMLLMILYLAVHSGYLITCL